MTMDVIAGMVFVSAGCMFALAITALAGARSRGEGSGNQRDAFTSRLVATVVVVFFVSATDLLLIAQQVSLALGTFVIGILLVALLYVEPALRTSKQASGEKEDWRA